MSSQIVTFTDSAKKYFNNIAKSYRNSHTPFVGFTLGVNGKGCHGYSYDLKIMSSMDDESKYDSIEIDSGVFLYIDKSAVVLILGTVIDYQTSAFSSGVTYSNPLETSRCGCGESFSV